MLYDHPDVYDALFHPEELVRHYASSIIRFDGRPTSIDNSPSFASSCCQVASPSLPFAMRYVARAGIESWCFDQLSPTTQTAKLYERYCPQSH